MRGCRGRVKAGRDSGTRGNKLELEGGGWKVEGLRRKSRRRGSLM